MRRALTAMLATGLLAGPMAAHAGFVTWEFKGEMTGVDNGNDDAFEEFTVGDPLILRWRFDANAAQAPGNPGDAATLYRYFADTMTGLVVQAGPVSNIPVEATPNARIIVRDNVSMGAEGVVDGLTFSHIEFDPNDGGFYTFVSHIMRGPVLDIINGPGIPRKPDPRLAELPTALFQICRTPSPIAADCSMGFLSATIDSVRAVPEPVSLALFGLGLAGLGLTRRRIR